MIRYILVYCVSFVGFSLHAAPDNCSAAASWRDILGYKESKDTKKPATIEKDPIEYVCKKADIPNKQVSFLAEDGVVSLPHIFVYEWSAVKGAYQKELIDVSIACNVAGLRGLAYFSRMHTQYDEIATCDRTIFCYKYMQDPVTGEPMTPAQTGCRFYKNITKDCRNNLKEIAGACGAYRMLTIMYECDQECKK